MEQRTNSKVAAGPASALAETGPSALAETMAYVQKQRLDSVEDLDTAVAPCTPKPGSKRVCMDYAYQMLCELDILARRRGDVVFLQSGTLLQVLRDGKLREDDDDIDVGYIDYKPRGFEDKIHPLKGTHYTDMCRIGYYEEEGVGGMVISPGHELVEKRFNNSGGGPSLPECLKGTTYLSKIEFWPYIAIDASSTAIYYPPPSLAPRGAKTIAVSYHKCMNYAVETIADGLNYTSVSTEGSDLKWSLPIQRQAATERNARPSLPLM